MDLDVYLAAIAAGDARAFGSWLAGAEPVLRLSLRSFATSVDTEAVLQESLLRTWQVAPRVQRDGRPNALLRLARRITRNHAIDEVRRLRPTADLADLDRAQASELQPSPPDPLLREVLHACLEALAATPRRALQARMAGGAHDRELAQEVDMTLNTFLKNIGRARRLLLDCLAGRGISLEAP